MQSIAGKIMLLILAVCCLVATDRIIAAGDQIVGPIGPLVCCEESPCGWGPGCSECCYEYYDLCQQDAQAWYDYCIQQCVPGPGHEDCMDYCLESYEDYMRECFDTYHWCLICC